MIKIIVQGIWLLNNYYHSVKLYLANEKRKMYEFTYVLVSNSENSGVCFRANNCYHARLLLFVGLGWPIMPRFYIFFAVSLNNLLNKQFCCRQFETQWSSFEWTVHMLNNPSNKSWFGGAGGCNFTPYLLYLEMQSVFYGFHNCRESHSPTSLCSNWRICRHS